MMRDPETLSPEEFAAEQQERFERDIRAEIAGKYDRMPGACFVATDGVHVYTGKTCIRCGASSSPHTRTP